MQLHKQMVAGLLVSILVTAALTNTALIVIDMFKGVY